MTEYIERDKLLMNLAEECDKYNPEFLNSSHIRYGISLAAIIIKHQPAFDVAEVRHGKNTTQINPVDEFICSECGFRCGDYSEIIYEEEGDYEYSCECVFNYCPHCGAKMDLGDDEG